MKEQDQIKALAELDGWIWLNVDNTNRSVPLHEWKRKKEYTTILPDYLTSYDAIIPLIQKQKLGIRQVCHLLLADLHGEFGAFLMATPSQLCETLLLAMGKWKEEV